MKPSLQFVLPGVAVVLVLAGAGVTHFSRPSDSAPVGDRAESRGGVAPGARVSPTATASAREANAPAAHPLLPLATDFRKRAEEIESREGTAKLKAGADLLAKRAAEAPEEAARLARSLLEWTLRGDPDGDGRFPEEPLELTEADYRAVVETFAAWAKLDVAGAAEWLDGAQDDYAAAVLRSFAADGSGSAFGNPEMLRFLEALAAGDDAEVRDHATWVYADYVVRRTDPQTAFEHLQTIGHIDPRLARNLVTDAVLRIRREPQ